MLSGHIDVRMHAPSLWRFGALADQNGFENGRNTVWFGAAIDKLGVLISSSED